MIKRFCDMCGAELDSGVKENIKIGAWVHIKGYGDNAAWNEPVEGYDSFKSFAYDVCNDCSHKVIAFITGKDLREVL